MNWLMILMKALQAAPAVVQFVEQTHKNASGSTKKDMAMSSLGFATGISEFMLPQYKDAIDAASSTVSGAIDGIVATAHAAGVFTKKDQPSATTVEKPVAEVKQPEPTVIP